MEEIERKLAIQQTFDTIATGYDNSATRFFPDSAKHIVSYLKLRGNEIVLDVATGTGNFALAIAEQLPEGQVVGIDFSQGMLAQANAKKACLAIRNVEFMEMDMQSLDFPDNHFDVAVCAFSIFFVEDMQSLLKLMADKVKSDGKVVVTSFAEDSFLPLSEIFLNRIQQYGVEIPPMTWKRVASERKCTALLKSAGLEETACSLKDNGYYLENADQWWELLWNAGYRGLISQLSPDALHTFKQEHLAEIQKLASSDGIWLDVNVLYSSGVKV